MNAIYSLLMIFFRNGTIKSYDVLIFTETKTDEFDELKLPEEYTYFAKDRKKLKKNQAG
jgi:hypothetical protein